MATYQKQWEMTVAARGQSYPRWRAVIHKRKHHKEGNHVRNGHDREREAPSQMKWNRMRSFPLPVVFETANTTRRGKLLLVVFKMEEKATGEAPPHRIPNKRSATKRVSPLCSKWKKRRRGKPLPITFQTKVRQRGFSCHVQNGKRDEDEIAPSHSVQNERKCDEEGFPPSSSCSKHKTRWWVPHQSSRVFSQLAYVSRVYE